MLKLGYFLFFLQTRHIGTVHKLNHESAHNPLTTAFIKPILVLVQKKNKFNQSKKQNISGNYSLYLLLIFVIRKCTK